MCLTDWPFYYLRRSHPTTKYSSKTKFNQIDLSSEKLALSSRNWKSRKLNWVKILNYIQRNKIRSMMFSVKEEQNFVLNHGFKWISSECFQSSKNCSFSTHDSLNEGRFSLGKRLFLFIVLNKYTNMWSNRARETMALLKMKEEKKKNKREVTVAKALFTISFLSCIYPFMSFRFLRDFFPTSLDAFSVVFHMWSLSEVNVFISHSVKRNAISQRFLNHLTRYSCIFCKNKYNNSTCCFHMLLERNPKHDLFMIHSQRENVRIKKMIQRWKYL